MKHVRKRLTYANVMSSLAVFLVLGGGAAVAAGLGKNSVGTAQIKRNAVKVGKLAPEAVKAGKLAKNAVPTNRLRDNAVSANKIANGSILTDKITDEAVTSGKLAKESVLTDKIGDDEVTGAKVKESSLGEVPSAAKLNGQLPSQFLGSEIVLARKTTNVAAGARGFANVACPANHQVISGGVRFDELDDDNRVTYNGPAFSGQTVTIPAADNVPTAWQASAVNGSATPDDLYVWAICAKLHSP